jgi:hypothetical protein
MRILTIIAIIGLAVACGDTTTNGEEADAGVDDGDGTGVVVVEGTVESSTECDACGGACTEEVITYESRGHLGPIEYLDSPPAGGDHDGCWAEWGVHDDELAPRNWIHNLEHGGVVILYDCPDGCVEDITTLSSYVEGVEGVEGALVILTSYTGLPTQFAAVAWQHRILLECADTDALDTFIEENGDQAPESVAAGPPASCM